MRTREARPPLAQLPDLPEPGAVAMSILLYLLAASACAFVGLLIGVWLGSLTAYKGRYVEGWTDAVAKEQVRVARAREKAFAKGFDSGWTLGINDRKESLR